MNELIIGSVNLLKYWLRPKKNIFRGLSKYVLDKDKYLQRRVFIDRKSKILMVAHLDTVLKPRFIREDPNKIYSTGLDDRLGAMISYELSKELGTDLLLTDHEESGKTTAKFHTCKDYNWIVEFDRRGEDVVTYDLDSEKFVTCLEEYFKIGWGSFSDIAALNTDVCCFNVGIGYENPHGGNSYFDVKVFNEQIDRFLDFYDKYKDTKFIQDHGYYRKRSWGFSSYSNYSYSGYTKCHCCGIWSYANILYKGKYYCNDCILSDGLDSKFDDILIPCSYCGNYFESGELIYYDGELLCSDCFDKWASPEEYK